MPNADTMEVGPIRQLVMRYVQPNMQIVDPFARNCRIANWRNDLNPGTLAEHHLDALDFLRMVQSKVAADLVLFDPPFSPRQIKECYSAVGIKMQQLDAFRTHWKPERDAINAMLKVGGIVISFGWNTIGMGGSRLYDIVEILCVCHGPGHNDTLVTVERKAAHQMSLFGAQELVESGATAPNTQSTPLCSCGKVATNFYCDECDDPGIRDA